MFEFGVALPRSKHSALEDLTMLVSLDSSGLPMHLPAAIVQDDPATPAALADVGVQTYWSDRRQHYDRLWVDRFPTAEHSFPKFGSWKWRWW